MNKAAARVEILGVRHHGPGSARSVAHALDRLRPSTVVIEGPPELDVVAHLAASSRLRPPVAGLVYDIAEPRHAAFYPMAAFSPEWVALRWATRTGAAVRFADLPAANALALDPSDSASARVSDPLGTLAAAVGYDDAERWWEDAIEQRHPADPLARFDAIRAAMGELRRTDVENDDDHEDERTLRREASMRKILRSARKTSGDDETIVFVCGAYHAPVLHPEAWPAIKDDNDRLKGLAKTKVAATWAPWTSARLAFSSGYGAGVTAPGWYHHLFAGSEAGTAADPITGWMVGVARALRDEGFEASSASAVEATRLAHTLAALRGRPLAGLPEVDDAARTVLAQGSSIAMVTVQRRLLVGDHLGSVPDDTPMVPLAQDLARRQKSLRLKPSAAAKTVTLDLRNKAQVERSVLLRRLAMLGIDWATEAHAGNTTGTFKEVWDLEWRPELSVAVIEASLWGTTIEAAAANRVVADAEGADLPEVSRLVEACLPAELPDALSRVLEILAERTARAADHLALMNAVEPLARTRRYGDVRGVDTEVVHDVLDALVARVAIGLTPACASLDDDAASEMRSAIEAVERGVGLVADASLRTTWRDALGHLGERDVHGSVVGRVTRILLDAGRIDIAEADRRLSRALTLAADPSMAAAWLDGFLAGDAVILLHDASLFGVVDDWLSGLAAEDFEDLLPLVRRTFSRFAKPERRQIGEVVSRGVGATRAAGGDEIDVDRAAPAVAKVASLLGLSPAGVPA